jgi:hypothetical protein
VIHANHSAQQESDFKKMTNATSGHSSSDCLARFHQESHSWRMLQGWLIPPTDSPLTLSPCLETLPKWGSMQGGELWEHGTPERPIKGTGGSAWPTPDGQVMNEGDTAWQERREREKAKHRNGNGFGLTIVMAVSLWPTPDTTNIGDGTPYETLKEALLARRERTKLAVQEGRVQPGSGRSENLAMAVQAPMWSTPSTMDHIERHGMRPSRAATGRKTGYLSEQLAGWPTPTAHDGSRPGSDAFSTQGGNLKREGENWATGPQAPRTPMPGQESSPSDQTSHRRLMED